MATTTAPETKTLVNYRVEDGIAVIELNDPPANTYTYEMNRQLDECILKARMDNDVYVLLVDWEPIAADGATFKIYFCRHAT